MICKNCKNEFEKGKFCPECGFPVEEEKKKSSERALEVLEKVEKRLAKLEEIEIRRNEKLDELRKKEKNGKKSEGTGTSKRTRSLLDIFD
jgi:predicted nucleic acid-binding Zn ribbon protein